MSEREAGEAVPSTVESPNVYEVAKKAQPGPLALTLEAQLLTVADVLGVSVDTPLVSTSDSNHLSNGPKPKNTRSDITGRDDASVNQLHDVMVDTGMGADPGE